MSSNGYHPGWMREFLRSNLLGLVAIFIAMSGTAYAVQANSIKSKHVVNESLTGNDICCLDTSDIVESGLTGDDINNRSLRGIDIDKESIGWPELGPDSVGDSEIANNQVKGHHIVESTLNPLIAHKRERLPECRTPFGEESFKSCGTLNFKLERQKPVLLMITYRASGFTRCQLRYDGNLVSNWEMDLTDSDSNGSTSSVGVLSAGGVPILDVLTLPAGWHEIDLACRGWLIDNLTMVALELGLDN